MDFKSASNFAFLGSSTIFYYFFLNWRGPKINTTVPRWLIKGKKGLHKCIIEYNFTSISDLGILHFLIGARITAPYSAVMYICDGKYLPRRRGI
jgi:hypothetical protein